MIRNSDRPNGGDVHALLGAFVLDAVDDVERAAFARHLGGCEACRVEVAELRGAAARLGDPVVADPPVEMRARVLEATHQTRQLPPTATPPTGHAALKAVRLWRRRTAAAVAAAVLAVAAAATTFLLQESRVRDERDRAGTVAAVLAAPDAEVRRSAIDGGGRASMVVSAGRDEAVVVFDDLPDVARELTYQLWLIRGDDARSAGVLGSSVAATPVLVTGVGNADLFGLTIEPDGGSAVPSTDPLVTLSVD